MDKREKIAYFLSLTREEKRVLLFLIISLILGSSIVFYTKIKGPPIPSHLLEEKERRETIRVDINKASLVELIRLPGIGPVLAKRIIEFRERRGPFKKYEDLLKVKGIGRKTLERIKPYILLEESE
jgi:competence protein ComEA